MKDLLTGSMMISIVTLLMLINLNLQAQTNTYKDARDGRIYNTIDIGETVGFKENLKFETRLSHCPNFNKNEGDCEHGNYYSNFELESLCPEGWRIATLNDWENYFAFMKMKFSIADKQINIDTLTEKAEGAMVIDMSGKIKLHGEDTPLGLEAIGWVEGNTIENYGAITLWMPDQKKRDQNYHVHIANRSYVRHTHEHHIIDVPDKVRKFCIRCVYDTFKKNLE